LVINTRKPDDQAIQGRVFAEDPEHITLTESMYLARDGSRQMVAGLVRIPRRNISAIQEPDPA
jgi:hypothetical protein